MDILLISTYSLVGWTMFFLAGRKQFHVAERLLWRAFVISQLPILAYLNYKFGSIPALLKALGQ